MKISIIMSTYEEFETGALMRAVSSVLAQSYPDWELIIVGDHTPQGTSIRAWCASLNDTRIQFINLAKRAGLDSPGTIPKIKGIKHATGELMAFLDADNEYTRNHLKHCMSAFQKDPSLDLVYGDALIKISGPDRWHAMPNFIWKKPKWTKKQKERLRGSNFLDMSEAVFTKKAYNASGGLNTTHHAADWLLWQDMVSAGHHHFKHLPHIGLIYYTTSLSHHLQYFLFMLAQKSGIRYSSEMFSFIQKSIHKRFKKKHGSS